jgi:hypothetical protein
LVRGGACRQPRRSRSRRPSVPGSRATPEQLEQHRSAGARQSANPIPTVAVRSVVAGAAISTTLPLSARRKSPRWCGRFTRVNQQRRPGRDLLCARRGYVVHVRSALPLRGNRARVGSASLPRRYARIRVADPARSRCAAHSDEMRAGRGKRVSTPVSLGARGAASEALRGDRCRSCERPTDGEPVSAFVGWRRSQRRRRA